MLFQRACSSIRHLRPPRWTSALVAAAGCMAAVLGHVYERGQLQPVQAQGASNQCVPVTVNVPFCTTQVNGAFPSLLSCETQKYAVWVQGAFCAPVDGQEILLTVFGAPPPFGPVPRNYVFTVPDGATTFEWSTAQTPVGTPPLTFEPMSFTLRSKNEDPFMQFGCVKAAKYCAPSSGQAEPRPSCAPANCEPIAPPDEAACAKSQWSGACTNHAIINPLAAPAECSSGFRVAFRARLCDYGGTGSTDFNIYIRNAAGTVIYNVVQQVPTVNEWAFFISPVLTEKPAKIDIYSSANDVSCVSASVYCHNTQACVPNYACNIITPTPTPVTPTPTPPTPTPCPACRKTPMDEVVLDLLMPPSEVESTGNRQLMWRNGTPVAGKTFTVPVDYRLTYKEPCATPTVVVSPSIDHLGDLTQSSQFVRLDDTPLVQAVVTQEKSASAASCASDNPGDTIAGDSSCFAAAKHHVEIPSWVRDTADGKEYELVKVEYKIDVVELGGPVAQSHLREAPYNPDACAPEFNESRAFTLAETSVFRDVTPLFLGFNPPNACLAQTTLCDAISYTETVTQPTTFACNNPSPVTVVTAWRGGSLAGPFVDRATFTGSNAVSDAVRWVHGRPAGRVDIPAGSFNIAAPIQVSVPLVVWGSGGRPPVPTQTTLNLQSGTAFFIVTPGANGFELNNVVAESGSATDAVHIDGISTGRLYCNTLKADHHGAFLNDVSNFTVDLNAILTGSNAGSAHALKLQYGDHNLVTANQITAAQNGIHLFDEDATDLTGNVVLDAGASGIFFSETTNSSAFQNIVELSGGHGIALGPVSTGNSMAVNQVLDAGANGIILFSGSDDNDIVNNWVQAADGDGIFVMESDRNSVTGNAIDQGQNGITVHLNSLENLIESNTIKTDVTGNGVQVANGSTNTIVRGNDIDGVSDSGVLVDASVGATIDANIIRNVGIHGVAIRMGSDGALVDGNVIEDAVGNGVEVKGSSNDAVIDENQIRRCGLRGVDADSSKDLWITNNVIERCDYEGLLAANGSTGRTGPPGDNVDNNAFDCNGLVGMVPEIVLDATTSHFEIGSSNTYNHFVPDPFEPDVVNNQAGGANVVDAPLLPVVACN